MRNIIKKGFTLIELLVVITIIWILATGATSVYTSQIQKARDSTRLNDIQVLQSAVEQAYQDGQEYPTTKGADFATAIQDYIDRFPEDPKFLKPWNKSWEKDDTKRPTLWYTYNVWTDDNWIEQSKYEVSTAFEANWNITSKAKKDAWNDKNRLEIWIKVDSMDSSFKYENNFSCDSSNTSTSKALVIHSNSEKLCGAVKY
jgi:prepilin-type N-terminal cleavage/methylation domain-containing protein